MKRQSERRAKGTGSLFRRNGKFVYQWTCVTGKTKTKTLTATNQDAAQKEINEILQEETRLSTIESKIAYMRQIAEAKALLHVCREPIEKIEDAYWSHPSAPEISPHHRGNYHNFLIFYFTCSRLLCFQRRVRRMGCKYGSLDQKNLNFFAMRMGNLG